MKTKVQYACGDDLDACKWGGFMGHPILLVRDGCDATRAKPRACVMANTVESAAKDAKVGDRIYQHVAPGNKSKSWKLVLKIA